VSGDKLEFRYSQINSFKESGMSVAAWCKENQIKAPTLRYWLHKIEAEETTTRRNASRWSPFRTGTRYLCFLW